MKQELITIWFHAVFMVTENGVRREYPIYTQGNSEISAAVSAAVGITESNIGLSNPTFKSIRVVTYGEQEALQAELDATCDEEEGNDE